MSAMMAKCPRVIGAVKHLGVRSLRQAVVRLSILKQRNPAAVAGERALSQCLERMGHSSENLRAEIESRVNDPEPSAAENHHRSQAQSLSVAPPHRHRESLEQTTMHPDATTTAASSFARSQPEFAFDRETLTGPDIFSQIMDGEAWTASWLEQMNRISTMSFDFDEDAFTWEEGLPTTLSTASYSST